MNREELVLIVCRTNITPATLEPLQLIIPTLKVAAPFSLYTSLGQEVQAQNRTEIYNALADQLEREGECSLSDTLRNVFEKRKDSGSKFRVCILGGEQVSWDIVLEYKRKKILIDTAGT